MIKHAISHVNWRFILVSKKVTTVYVYHIHQGPAKEGIENMYK